MNSLQLENKKILVLGGSGFIGQEVISELLHHENLDLFKNQYDVLLHNTNISLNHPHFKIKNLDQIINESLTYDVVIDLVSSVHGYRNESDATFKNEVVFRNILDQKILPRCQRKIVISSGVVYGDQVTCPNEDSPILSTSSNLYTQSKIDLEKRYLQNIKKNDELIILRLFSVYGPKMNPQMLISQLIQAEESNSKFILKAPQQKRSFLFVTDAVKVILQMLCRSDLSGIYNVSSKHVIELNELKKYFKCIAQDPSISSQAENALTTSDFHGNSQKLIQHIGEFEGVGLEEGIGLMLEV